MCKLKRLLELIQFKTFCPDFTNEKLKWADNGALWNAVWEMEKVLWDKISKDMEDPLIFFIDLLFFSLGTETRNGIY